MAYLTDVKGLELGTDLKYCIQPWGENSLAPCTIKFNYDDTPEVSVEIGGNTCHMCGARTVETNVNTAEVGKKKNRHMVTTRYVHYACGTDVSRRDGEEPCVEVGRKCIQFPIPQERW